MTEPTMVERVARALAEAAGVPLAHDSSFMQKQARAAIAAMRDLDHEADAGMLIAGHAQLPEMNPCQGDFAEAWEAAIDAALAEMHHEG